MLIEIDVQCKFRTANVPITLKIRTKMKCIYITVECVLEKRLIAQEHTVSESVSQRVNLIKRHPND